MILEFELKLSLNWKNEQSVTPYENWLTIFYSLSEFIFEIYYNCKL